MTPLPPTTNTENKPVHRRNPKPVLHMIHNTRCVINHARGRSLQHIRAMHHIHPHQNHTPIACCHNVDIQTPLPILPNDKVLRQTIQAPQNQKRSQSRMPLLPVLARTPPHNPNIQRHHLPLHPTRLLHHLGIIPHHFPTRLPTRRKRCSHKLLRGTQFLSPSAGPQRRHVSQ